MSDSMNYFGGNISADLSDGVYSLAFRNLGVETIATLNTRGATDFAYM